MNTQQLIASLIAQTPTRQPLRSAEAMVARTGGLFAVYGILTQAWLGLRPDITTQLGHPLFLLEIVLLVLIASTSLIAAVLLMYPDRYQRGAWLRWPMRLTVIFSLLIVLQLGDQSMVERLNARGMECTLCIALVALLPSLVLMLVLRRGATTSPQSSGIYAILAATSMSCLTLRLSEVISSMPHLVMWHYMPTLLFAGLGAAIGRCLLKW